MVEMTSDFSGPEIPGQMAWCQDFLSTVLENLKGFCKSWHDCSLFFNLLGLPLLLVLVDPGKNP